jgi:lysophospholipase L1-like esterase
VKLLWLLWLVPIAVVLNIIKSGVMVFRLSRGFHKIYKPNPDLYELGTGPVFHIALLGDSGIDGHRGNTLKFGPAQTIIEKLAEHHTVIVHVFAKEGTKTYQIIERQLPKLRALPKVDMVLVYMGANNAIRGFSSHRVISDYRVLLDYAKQINLPIVATEIADYYYLPMFSWIHKLVVYMRIESCNRQLWQLTKLYDNFVLGDMSWLTKKFIGPEYMADALHPNDKMIRLWADAAYSATKESPATKEILS